MAANKPLMANGETTLTVNMMSLGEGAFSVDQRRRIVSWNDTATQLLGYASKDVLGKLCHRVLGLCDAQSKAQPCNYSCFTFHNAGAQHNMHLVEAEVPHFETEVAGRDGRAHRLNVTLLPARTQTGETRVVHLLRDVSDQHQAADTVTLATPAAPPRGDTASPAPAPAPADQPTHARPQPQLTPRELEVLHLLASGLANGEIAAQLSISPITARNHVTNVIEKLHVRTRLQAVIAASRLGLL